MTKQLHLGAFMRPVGIHTAWWRVPGAYPDANFNLQHLVDFIQTLEQGRFDAFFMADHLAVLNMSMAALIPGLEIQVEGAYNSLNQLEAKSVKFKGNDLERAQSIQAGVYQTKAQSDRNRAEDSLRHEPPARFPRFRTGRCRHGPW